MGKRSRSAQTRRRRESQLHTCGSPTGCSQLADHVVVEPLYGGVFGACSDHWPDFVAMLWAEGAWVTGCPCEECVS